MSKQISAFLFVSSYCPYSSDLLRSYNEFRDDVFIELVDVDENEPKTRKLINKFDIRGVPTLVIDDEKYAEGEDVFTVLLPSNCDDEKKETPQSSSAFLGGIDPKFLDSVADVPLTGGRDTYPGDTQEPQNELKQIDGSFKSGDNNDMEKRLMELQALRKL